MCQRFLCFQQDCLQYQALQIKTNESFVDREAQRWLKSHSHEIAVIDCDKNLGDALVPRSWATEVTTRLLTESFEALRQSTMIEVVQKTQYDLRYLLYYHEFKGNLTYDEKRFVTPKFGKETVGKFRIRITNARGSISSQTGQYHDCKLAATGGHIPRGKIATR